jgi:hypothetical protein
LRSSERAPYFFYFEIISYGNQLSRLAKNQLETLKTQGL